MHYLHRVVEAWEGGAPYVRVVTFPPTARVRGFKGCVYRGPGGTTSGFWNSMEPFLSERSTEQVADVTSRTRLALQFKAVLNAHRMFGIDPPSRQGRLK